MHTVRNTVVGILGVEVRIPISLYVLYRSSHLYRFKESTHPETNLAEPDEVIMHLPA